MDNIKDMQNLMKQSDTYQLSIVTCFCASIDPEKKYRYGSAV